LDFKAEEFWGELVLSGIGGRTIEEAKRNISTKEFEFWKAYRLKYGSLSVIRRIEQGFGGWMAHYTHFQVEKGTDIDPFDFMPHEEAPTQTFEQQRMKAIQEKSG
jgi:hypothetical protein